MIQSLALASFALVLALVAACRAPATAEAPLASPPPPAESRAESDSLVRGGALRIDVAWDAQKQRASTSIAGRPFATAAEVGDRAKHELELAQRAGTRFVTQLAGEPQVPWSVIEELVGACKHAGVADIEFLMP